MKYPDRILNISEPHVRALMKFNYRDVHKNNFGYFGVYTGLPGHGKTESAMLHAYIQDGTFSEDTLKERVCTKPKDFLRAINDMERYQWCMWMDAGLSTSLSSRNWHKVTNTLVNDTTMLMRIKRIGVIFDSQMIGFIDKSTRSLFRWFIEVKRFEQQPPRLSIHNIQVNQRYGKIYFPHPVFRINGHLVKLARISLKSRLPKPMRRKFDELHSAAKEGVLKRHYKTIEKIEAEEVPRTIFEMIEEAQDNIKKFRNKRGTIDLSLIKLHFGVGRGKAEDIKKFLENMGKTKNVKNTMR